MSKKILSLFVLCCVLFVSFGCKVFDSFQCLEVTLNESDSEVIMLLKYENYKEHTDSFGNINDKKYIKKIFNIGNIKCISFESGDGVRIYPKFKTNSELNKMLKELNNLEYIDSIRVIGKFDECITYMI